LYAYQNPLVYVDQYGLLCLTSGQIRIIASGAGGAAAGAVSGGLVGALVVGGLAIGTTVASDNLFKGSPGGSAGGSRGQPACFD
jgi:hypothetical protein